MMRIAYNEATCRERSSIELDLALCREHGIGEIELRFDMIDRYLAQNSPRMLRELIANSGVKPITLNAIFNINFLDEAQRLSIEKQMRRACEIGKLLDIDCVIVLPTACDDAQKHTWEEIRRDSIANLTWMADIGSETGMRIAFEPIGAQERCVRSIKQSWEIVRDIDRRDVGLALDAYNLYLYKALADVDDMLLIDPAKIFIVHIDDADPAIPYRKLGTFDRMLLEEGSIDLDAFLNTLKRIGYDGACSIEILNQQYWKPYYCYRSTELSFFGKFKDGHTPLSQNGAPVNSFFGQSSFATHAIVPAVNAVKVDKDVDLKLLAPLGCGVQTGAGAIINALKPEPADSVVIFGTGTVGLSGIMGAAAIGCKRIIAVDIIDSRLEMAKEYGATHVINSKTTQDVAAAVKELTDGKGADYALDTTGVEVCTLAALKSLHTGGKGACVAASKKLTFDPAPSYLIGRSWSYLIEGEAIPQEFIPQMIDWYKQGRFPFDRMVSFYPFEKINEAFEDTRKGLATKAVLVMPE